MVPLLTIKIDGVDIKNIQFSFALNVLAAELYEIQEGRGVLLPRFTTLTSYGQCIREATEAMIKAIKLDTQFLNLPKPED